MLLIVETSGDPTASDRPGAQRFRDLTPISGLQCPAPFDFYQQRAVEVPMMIAEMITPWPGWPHSRTVASMV